jgi:signal transduction histidine kinase
MSGRLRDGLLGVFVSLRAKVIFTVVTVLIAMTGLTGYIWYYNWREQLIELTEDQISILFQSVEMSIEMAMQEGRHADLGEILRRIAQRDEVLSLRIYDTHGIIRRSSLPEEEGSRPADLDRHEAMGLLGLRLTSLREGEGGNLRLMYPIKKKRFCVSCHETNLNYVGVLEMHLSLDTVQDIIRTNRDRMVLFVIATVLVLSLTIAFLFEREVQAPISTIVETINEIEAGNLGARIDLDTRDEFGLVARNVNSMVGKLENAIGEIRKYHRKELKKSQRLAAIGELAASISHEIRNPLAGIKGAIQVILNEEGLDERRAMVLREVLAQVDRLNGTVTDLLSFSRPLSPEISPADVGCVLDRTLDPLKLEPFLGETTIERDWGRLEPVPIDPNLVEQAFFNIVMNALQAMGGKGRLKVTAREEEEGVVVTFEDDGPGISPENLERIFRPFFTTKHRGTGLGLSISRNIVEAHGGSIEVRSEPGRGTTFRVTLPTRLPEES